MNDYEGPGIPGIPTKKKTEDGDVEKIYRVIKSTSKNEYEDKGTRPRSNLSKREHHHKHYDGGQERHNGRPD